MKALLICPSERPAVRLLAPNAPLSNVPLLGQSLLEYWLSHLACSGLTQALILAGDRPEKVRALAALWTKQFEDYAALATKDLPPESKTKPNK